MEKTRDPKKICTTIGLAMFAMMAVWLLFSYAMFGGIARSAAPLGNAWLVWLVNDIPLYLLAAPVYLLILATIPDGPVYARPTLKPTAGKVMLALLFCFGITYILNLASTLLLLILQLLFGGAGAAGSLDSLALMGPESWLANLIFGACVPALGEEYLFRYLLRKKMRGCADITYILMSGLGFSLFHANLSQMLYAFALGAFFAWVYLVTGNIRLPVLFHFTINLFGILIMPNLALNPAAIPLVLLFFFGTVITAIILFCMRRRWTEGTLLPPTELGWPYNPPRPKPVYYPPVAQARQPYAPQPPAHYAPTPRPGAPAMYAAAARQPWAPPPYAPPAYAAPAYAPPAHQPPAYTPPVYARVPVLRPPHQPVLGFCLGRPGVVLYLVLAGLMTLWNLASTLGLFY